MAICCEPNEISISTASMNMFALSSTSASERLSLRKKLIDELTCVRRTAKKLELLCSKDLTAVDGWAQKSLSGCAYNRQSSGLIQSVEGRVKKTGNHLSTASHGPINRGLKRAPPQSVEGAPGNKKRKLDGDRMKQCVDVLKKLMSHPFGSVFNQPVDPVKLNIPDYFTIITKPMDLGTIKSKLESKCYVGVRDFASDVRLTFSNAMRYNPPVNDVHDMAKSLNNMFNKSWRTLEEKWGKDSSTVRQDSKKTKWGTGEEKWGKDTSTVRQDPKKTKWGTVEEKCGKNTSTATQDSKKTKWGTVEEKWGKDTSTATQDPKKTNVSKQAIKSQRFVKKEPVYCVDSPVRRSLTLADKQKLRQDLSTMSVSKLPVQLMRFLQKHGSCVSYLDKIEMDVDVLDDDEAQELKKLIRGYMESKSMKSGGTVSILTPSGRCSCPSTLKGSRGGDLVASNGCRNPRADCTHGICDDMSIHGCSSRNDFTKSANDVDSENSAHKGVGLRNVMNPLAKHANVARKQRSDQNLDTDGSAGVLDEANALSSPNGTAASVGLSREGTRFTSKLQPSPSRALRAAMLKSRFAETILKAQQKTLFNNGGRRDGAQMHRKKEMEREHQEENSRIEAAIRAVKAAQQAEAKRKIEQQREAARLAMQNIKRTVVINENEGILKDIEEFGNSFLSLQGGRNPLERLGLFLKSEDLDDDDVPSFDCAAGNGEKEEGEIVC